MIATEASENQGGSEIDRRAIRELHARDEAASKAQDFSVLRTLMSADAVVLAPGAEPKRGSTLHRSFRTKITGAEVLEYHFDWEEVRILGEYAFEWGKIMGRIRLQPTTAAQSQTFNVMRILKRVGPADWKIHRTIWNSQG
jgi:ketosteroid isomerase-like protein